MKQQLLLVAAIIVLMGLSAWAGFYLQSQRQTDAEVTVSTPEQAAGIQLLPQPPIATQPVTGLGEPVPDFSLPDLQGKTRSLSEWQGKVVVLNFWATWCPPCREEIPEFVLLQKKYAEQDLQFIGIALQQAHEVVDFVAEYQINYPILAGELEVIKLAESLGNSVGGLPYTVVIDRAGEVQFVKAGPLSREQAEIVITELL